MGLGEGHLKAIMQISTFTLNGLDIDVTYHNKSVAYTFERNGKHYGYKINLESKKIMDIVAATSLLLISALETKEAVEKLEYENNP